MARRLRLIALALFGLCIVAAGLFGAWKYRKRAMIRTAHADGLAAYERGEWETAGRLLGRYTRANRDDLEALDKYADAQLRVRPLHLVNIRQAMDAYREILDHAPDHERAFHRLRRICESIAQYSDLALAARRRLQALPADPPARFAEIRELTHRGRYLDARPLVDSLIADLRQRPDHSDVLVDACATAATIALAVAPTSVLVDRTDVALDYLRLACDRVPESPTALINLAMMQRQRAILATDPQQRAGLLRESRTTLEKARDLGAGAPADLLRLSEAWLGHRDFDQAAETLDVATNLDPESFRDVFIDPDDWYSLLFLQRGKLALLSGDTAGGVALADEITRRFRERRQFPTLLPVAFELYVAGGAAADCRERARECLAEYTDMRKLAGVNVAVDEQIAWMTALVARLESDWPRIIDALSPFADRVGVRAGIRSLLAEAYLASGQAPRAVQLLGSVADGATNESFGLALVRSLMTHGAWDDADRILAVLERATPSHRSPAVATMRSALDAAIALRDNAIGRLPAIAERIAGLCEANPDRTDTRLLLAAVRESAGDLDAAQTELTRATRTTSDPLAAYRALARLQMQRGQGARALAVLEEACREHPGSARSWLALASAHAELRDTPAACAALERGLERVHDAAERREVRIHHALIDLSTSQRRRGEETLRALLEEERQSGAVRDVRLRTLLLAVPDVARHAEEAARLLDEIEQIEGAIGSTWRVQRARVALAARDWRAKSDTIEGWLKFCVAEDPGRVDAVLLLGELYERLGEFAAAEGVYSVGFGASADIAVADRLLTLYQRTARFAEARQFLDRFRYSLGDAASGARQLALALSQGQYDEALQVIETRLRGERQDPSDLLRAAALTYVHKRSASGALEYLDRAERAGADPLAVTVARVTILLDQKQEQQALAILDALVLSSETPVAYQLRAAVHARLRNYERAEQDYRSYARLIGTELGPAMLGEFFAQRGNLDDAIATWETGLEQHPESIRLRRGLAKALIARGAGDDMQRAAGLLREIGQQAADDMDLLWARFVLARRSGTPEGDRAARGHLAAATDVPPGRPEDYVRFAAAAVELGDASLGRRLAEYAHRLFPNTPDVLTSRARLEIDARNLGLTAELAERAVSLDPTNVQAYDLLLTIAILRNDRTRLDSLRRDLDNLWKKEPRAHSWNLLSARALAAVGDRPAAIQRLRDFTRSESASADPAAVCALAEQLAAAGDYSAAHAELDRLGSAASARSLVRIARVSLLAAEQRWPAIDALLAEPDSPLDADLLVAAGRAMATDATRRGRAIELIRRAVDAGATNPSVLALLGDLLAAAGNADDAERAYRAALQRDESHAESLSSLALLLNRRDDARAEALTLAQRAVAMRPEDPSLRETLAAILLSAGRFDEARFEYQHCARQCSRDSPLRARALLRAAAIGRRLDPAAPVADLLEEVRRIDAQSPALSVEERAELARLTGSAAPRPE